MLTTIPVSRHSRWRLLRDFAKEFCRKPQPWPHSTEDVLAYEHLLDHKLPRAVLEWYELLDADGDYWTGHNVRIWSPETPQEWRRYCPIITDRQDAFRMGFRTSDAQCTDPPIWQYFDRIHRCSTSVSIFALQFFVYESTMDGKHSHYNGNGVDNHISKRIEHTFAASPLPDLPIFGPIRFLNGDDAVLCIDYCHGRGHNAFLSFAASTKRAFQRTIKTLQDLGVAFDQ